MGLASTLGMLLATAIAAAPADSRNGNERDLPRRIQSLVTRINERPDPSHSEASSAGLGLVELGVPALRHGALDLITSDDDATRRHGEFVLSAIVHAQCGFVPGRGWSDDQGPARFRELWETNGGYRPDMPEAERRKCYEQWTAWLATVEELTPRSNPNRLRPPRVDLPATNAP